MSDRPQGAPAAARWARITAAFDAALGQPEAERETLVRATLAGDDDAIAEVISLLASHQKAAGFLTGAAGAAALGRALAPVAIGATVGGWRVSQVLGEGGMGVVYRAEREGGEFRQTGALKLIRHALPSEELVQRFRRERQILASLEHPNIARLLDGGSTPEGLPYLVMEFVVGRPLYEFCSERSLAIEARIGLFLDVCAAVLYAHQRLVLHRDLKPGNLMVSENGSPKLLDFGIARVLDEDAPGDAPTLTRQAPMTPEYASPEQLLGQPVTTASDVYSLGVVLYELLTGVRPYPPSQGAQALLEHVTARDPERPSTAITRTRTAPEEVTTGGRRRLPEPPAGTVASLRRRLAGDLDNVVLKAMHRDPARRYASAEQLGEDLRRFLGGRTVSARADTWSYRASRFVRRNRLAVAAAAVALLALVGGLGVSLWQASVARQRGATAERRASEQRSLANALVFEIDGALAEVPGATRARLLLLTRAEEYLEKLWQERADDAGLRSDLADAYDQLGDVQGQPWASNAGLGDHAYVSMRRALELGEGLVKEQPNDPARLARQVRLLNRISRFERVHAKVELQLRHQLEAVAGTRRLLEIAPDSLRYRKLLPRGEHNLGLALMAADRDSEGLEMLRSSNRDFEVSVRTSPEDTVERILLSQALFGYAGALLEQHGSDTREALDGIRRSMEIQETLVRAGRPDPVLLRLYAGNLHLLGAIAAERNAQPDTAVAYERRVAAILQELTQADPGNRSMELSHSISRINLGNLLAAAHRPDEALPILREELERVRRWSREDASSSDYATSLIECLGGLGAAWRARAERAAPRSVAATAAWQSARGFYASSDALIAEWAARGDAWSADSTRRAQIRHSLAACDSAVRKAAAGR